jgi:hypothetical protein
VNKEQHAALRAAFPESAIGKLPRGNTMLQYVGHAATTDRLLEVDPEWTWEPVAFDEQGLPAFDQLSGLWIRMTVCGVTRYGYGSANGKKGPDAIKECIGDAIRNAAMRFGVALDLWAKEDISHKEVASPEEIEIVEKKIKQARTVNGLNKIAASITNMTLDQESLIALRAQYSQRKREIEEQQEIEAEIAEMNAELDEQEQTEPEMQ